MARIHVGCFDSFKGSDTLLIECDQDGLQSLIDVLRDVGTRGERGTLGQCVGVIVHGAISVAVERSRKDVGLVATDEDFVWRRSSEAWLEVVEKLEEMQRSGPCHQYLSNAPADVRQIIVAVEEYGEEWWRTHARPPNDEFPG